MQCLVVVTLLLAAWFSTEVCGLAFNDGVRYGLDMGSHKVNNHANAQENHEMHEKNRYVKKRYIDSTSHIEVVMEGDFKFTEKQLAWVRGRLHRNETAVLMFLSDSDHVVVDGQQGRSLVEPFLNSLILMNMNEVNRIVPVCLDTSAVKTLRSIGEDCLYINMKNWRNTHKQKKLSASVWQLRTILVSELLNHNINVVVTDADAFWLRNPFTLFDKVDKLWAKNHSGNLDIIASRAHFPTIENRQWGASICTGFVFLRATAAVQHFFVGIRSKAFNKTIKFDDQVAVNDELMLQGVAFDPNKTLGAVGRTIAFNVAGNFNIALLPEELAARNCSRLNPTKVVVMHCSSSRKETKRKEKALSNNVWLLPQEWKSIAKHASFHDWLQSAEMDAHERMATFKSIYGDTSHVSAELGE